MAFAESWASDLRNFDPAAFAAVADRAEQLAAAFEHAIETGAKEAGVRLITATWFYWVIRGRQQEADVWAQAILTLPGDLTPVWEMEGQIAASELARVNGDFQRAVRLKKSALLTADDDAASSPASTPTLRISSSGSVSSTSPRPTPNVRSS